MTDNILTHQNDNQVKVLMLNVGKYIMKQDIFYITEISYDI